MTAASDPAAESRFGNVTGALLVSRSRPAENAHRALAVRRLVGVLGELFEEVLVAGAETADTGRASRVATPGEAPSQLDDLFALLGAATSARVCVVSSDFALLDPAVLLMLLAYPDAEAVAPHIDDREEPLCCLYAREPASTAARARLREGATDAAALLAALDRICVEPADLAAVDPGAASFERLETADRVARFEAMLAGEPRRG